MVAYLSHLSCPQIGDKSADSPSSDVDLSRCNCAGTGNDFQLPPDSQARSTVLFSHFSQFCELLGSRSRQHSPIFAQIRLDPLLRAKFFYVSCKIMSPTYVLRIK